ncbi:MAG: hypothetical protein IPH09_12765 [bacterium]|nr:hypothetical protein [bacterium]
MFAQSYGYGVGGFVDENGDGFNDLAPDVDGDGIPNGLDPDYVPPADGSGAGFGPGDGDCTQTGTQNAGNFLYRLKAMWQSAAGAAGGFGPGDGTGNGGTGPGDGTGFGPGDGVCPTAKGGGRSLSGGHH